MCDARDILFFLRYLFCCPFCLSPPLFGGAASQDCSVVDLGVEHQFRDPPKLERNLYFSVNVFENVASQVCKVDYYSYIRTLFDQNIV